MADTLFFDTVLPEVRRLSATSRELALAEIADALCWRAEYEDRHGPLDQFLRKHPDLFTVAGDSVTFLLPAEAPLPVAERHSQLSLVVRLRGWAPGTTPAAVLEFLADVPAMQQAKIGERDVVFVDGHEPEAKRLRPDAPEESRSACELRVASEAVALEIMEAKHGQSHNGRQIQIEVMPDVNGLLLDPELQEGSTLILPLDSAASVRKLLFVLQVPLYQLFQVPITSYCTVIPLPDPAAGAPVPMDTEDDPLPPVAHVLALAEEPAIATADAALELTATSESGSANVDQTAGSGAGDVDSVAPVAEAVAADGEPADIA